MSGVSEATTVMTSREPFPVSQVPPPQQNPGAPSQLDQQMCLPYPTDGAYMPVGSSAPYQSIPGGSTVVKHAMNLNCADQKRKRGRPRKYGPDGSMAVAMTSSQQHPGNMGMQQSLNFSPRAESLQQAASVGGSALATAKKPRGRPPGSTNKKKQTEAIGSTGIAFTPHVINVKAGEDVSSKIMAFSQNGPRTVCILSANGVVSNVTLRQAATSGGTATYEGRFDILSLSGSFMLSEVAGQKSRTGGLSTMLAGPDGRVFGGCVAGLLIAAAPVQVIVGSFLADSRKEPNSVNHMDPSSTVPKPNLGSGTGGSSSPSHGTFSESSGGPASPLNLSSGVFNNHPQVMSAMPWK